MGTGRNADDREPHAPPRGHAEPDGKESHDKGSKCSHEGECAACGEPDATSSWFTDGWGNALVRREPIALLRAAKCSGEGQPNAVGRGAEALQWETKIMGKRGGQVPFWGVFIHSFKDPDLSPPTSSSGERHQTERGVCGKRWVQLHSSLPSDLPPGTLFPHGHLAARCLATAVRATAWYWVVYD